MKQLNLAEAIVGVGLEGGSVGPRELPRMRQDARARVKHGVKVVQGDASCTAAVQNEPGRVVGALVVVKARYLCPEPVEKAGMRLSVDLFPEFGVAHNHLVRMHVGAAERTASQTSGAAERTASQTSGGERHEASLSRIQSEMVVPGSKERQSSSGWLSFVRSGIVHILIGYDHLAFLLMLMLLAWLASRDRPSMLRDLAWTASAFTIGHSLTLGLAVSGVLRPEGRTVELLIACSIIVLALEGLLVLEEGTKRARQVALAVLVAVPMGAVVGVFRHSALPLIGLSLFAIAYLEWMGRYVRDADTRSRRAAMLRGGVALAFGLVHGFGFAGVLIESELSGSALIVPLLSFNVGVELGQIGVLAVLTLLLWKVKNARWRRLTVELGAAATFLLACYWLGMRA